MARGPGEVATCLDVAASGGRGVVPSRLNQPGIEAPGRQKARGLRVDVAARKDEGGDDDLNDDQQSLQGHSQGVLKKM